MSDKKVILIQEIEYFSKYTQTQHLKERFYKPYFIEAINPHRRLSQRIKRAMRKLSEFSRHNSLPLMRISRIMFVTSFAILREVIVMKSIRKY
jgi:hypothetical protein